MSADKESRISIFEFRNILASDLGRGTASAVPQRSTRNRLQPLRAILALAISAELKKRFIRNGIKVEDWGAVTVADALLDREQLFRCAECHAPVRPHKESFGQLAHFEHLREFDGCSLSQAFTG